MLVLQEIRKFFGDVHVLNGINLSLERGRVYTLKGGNGSGKTTLLNMVSGFLKPTSGTIRFQGKLVTKFAPYKVNRLGIGRTFHDLRLATQLTVYENILLALEKRMFAFPTRQQKSRIDEILTKVSLWDKRSELAGEISYGQQKLLTLGCCIANDADLLLIDEPVAGIDTANQAKVVTLVNDLKHEGKTILQIEHNTNYIDATSDKTFYLENGVVAC
jgi:branched-chain amino acid transport system ATP-binding protein